MALTYLEIDLTIIKNNIKNLRYLLSPNIKAMAVIKSNAYGHGIVEVAKSAIEAGCSWLGVVNVKEAMLLRNAGVRSQILVLGYPDFADIQNAAQFSIAVPVVSLKQAEQLSKYKLSYPLVVHLKVETGINRLGLKKNEIIKACELLKMNKQIVIEGLYSHFSSVEEEDIEYSKLQLKRFNEIVKLLEKRKINIRLKHLCATAPGIILDEAHFDMVRLGIGIYGLWPSEKIKKRFLKQNANNSFLQSALTYKTQIVQIKDVRKGESIGYGCTYKANKNVRIAIIPVGYYEGVDRLLSNPSPLGKNYKSGEVLIAGQRCPIVGRVCMNMTIIDVSEVSRVSKVSVGDEVVIIGEQEIPKRLRSGSQPESVRKITADEIADKIKTINYEIVTRIPEHIPRIYKI